MINLTNIYLKFWPSHLLRGLRNTEEEVFYDRVRLERIVTTPTRWQFHETFVSKTVLSFFIAAKIFVINKTIVDFNLKVNFCLMALSLVDATSGLLLEVPGLLQQCGIRNGLCTSALVQFWRSGLKIGLS